MGEVAKMNPGGVPHRASRLSISAEQEAFHPEQIDALKKMNGWRNVPEAELAVFFHQAKRSGLDPFSKQIYLIPRGGNFTIQTSIDGMRLVADRTGRYAGSDRPVFGKDGDDEYAEITVYKLVGNPPQRYGFTSVAYMSEYSTNTNLWKKMPKTMLAKCCEAQALRKAFPADLSGMYGQEEMDQAGSPVAAPQHHSEVVEADPAPQLQPEPESQGEAPNRLRESDQRIVVSEIEDMLDKAPDGFFENAIAMVGYARESYEKALAVRKKMRRLLDEGKPQESNDEAEADSHYDDGLSEEEQREIEESVDDAESAEDAEGRPNKNDLPATRKQLNYLERLVADVEDGVAKFEERAGKRIAELTREEASEWIGRLSGKAV